MVEYGPASRQGRSSLASGRGCAGKGANPVCHNRAMRGDQRFMRMAIELATENVRAAGGGPFGAVVVRAGEVVATGANQVTAMNDPTAHAEVVAIRNACRALGTFDLSGCEIYSSCEPCPMCLTAILWARCDGLYYGNTAEDAAGVGVR